MNKKSPTIITKLALLSFFGLLCLPPLSLLAATYQPGETLDPSCLPTDPACTVATSTSPSFTITQDGLSIGSSTPGVTLNTLYNQGSTLYWNGNELGFALPSSDALAEGLSHFYFTNARADSRFVAGLAGTSSVASITTLSNLLLSATQLTNFGAPFYQFFSATTTSALAEGANLYFTNARADARLSATTSLPNITTLTNLSLPATQLTNFGTPFYTFFNATTTDALVQGLTNKYYSTNLFAGSIAGTTTSALAEGSNLYFTNSRFDTRLSATTSLPNITTLAGLTSVPSLSLSATQLTNFGTPFYSFLSATTTNALSEGAVNKYYTDARVGSYISASSTVPHIGGSAFGDLLSWTGSAWTTRATSTLGVALTDTAGTLTVTRGGTGVTTFGQGWIFSAGDGIALSASTSPTVNYITATSTTATSTFAYGINITGGCFAKNGVCLGAGAGSDLQHAASYDTNEAFTNIPTGGAQTTLGTVSLTPSTATGDVYVTGWADVYSGDGADQPLQLVIETTSNCTGSTVGNASVTYTITSGVSAANDRGTIRISGISVDPGTSAQPYSLCAAITSGTGDTDVLNWGIEATVIDTGADLAEIYTTNDESLEAGDVVALDPALKAGVKKTTGVHDQNVLGIVSTRPGILIGGVDKEGVQALPVALSGRVPVKVITENGAIGVGDYLTPSSVPGVAMKSGGSGPVIGQAIEAYDEEGVGLVLAFVKNFDSAESTLLGGTSSSSSSVANIQSEASRNPVSIFVQKIADGLQFLTDFVAARVTAIRGYFDEVFARKVHTDELCLKKNDGREVCVGGDALQALTGAASAPVPEAPTAEPPASDTATSTDEGDAVPESPPEVPAPDPAPDAPDASAQ